MKCKICGKRFKLQKENRYIAEESLGVFQQISNSPTTYECFDCPYCGCQNRVNIFINIQKEVEGN